ncbi:hypothetical protein [uncultured Eubacterium sp.]|nr:hypothetical protein [uncultured Eubacterium sp.]
MNKFETPKIEIIMFNTPETTIGTDYLSGGTMPLDEEGYSDELTF